MLTVFFLDFEPLTQTHFLVKFEPSLKLTAQRIFAIRYVIASKCRKEKNAYNLLKGLAWLANAEMNMDYVLCSD